MFDQSTIQPTETRSHSLGENDRLSRVYLFESPSFLSLLSNDTKDLIASGLTLTRVIFFSLHFERTVAVCTAILFTMQQTTGKNETRGKNVHEENW